MKICFACFLSTTLFFSCSSSKKQTNKLDALTKDWSSSVEGVKLRPSKAEEVIASGECVTGTITGVHVDLCLYKDLETAASKKDVGLERIGANTGVSLVNQQLLLVAADREKVDVHGTVIDKIAKIFLDAKM